MDKREYCEGEKKSVVTCCKSDLSQKNKLQLAIKKGSVIEK
jgi:hypothetical protein